jgi:phage-related holin
MMFLQKKIAKKVKKNMIEHMNTIQGWISTHWEPIKLALYGLFAFLNINIDIVNVIMWLMLIDTISGVIKTIIVDKIKFTFKNFYLGIMSKFVLLLIPITLALMALGIGYDFTWAVEAIIRLIVLSEGISIVTNTISIRENRVLKNKDYLSIILNWVRKNLISLFDSTINKNKDR